MKKVILGVLLCWMLAEAAGGKRYAVDCGAGWFVNRAHYFPVYHLSFNWLRKKHIVELDGAFGAFFKGDDYTEKSYALGSVNLSLLYPLPGEVLYIGPVFGLYVTDYYNYKDGVTDELTAVYPLGISTTLLFGKKTVRLKVQNRLMAGLGSTGKSNFSVMNALSAGIMIAL